MKNFSFAHNTLGNSVGAGTQGEADFQAHAPSVMTLSFLPILPSPLASSSQPESLLSMLYFLDPNFPFLSLSNISSSWYIFVASLSTTNFFPKPSVPTHQVTNDLLIKKKKKSSSDFLWVCNPAPLFISFISYLLSLSFSFIICEMGMITAPTL